MNIDNPKGGAGLTDIVLKHSKKVKKILADLGYWGSFEDVARLTHKGPLEFASKVTGQFIIQAKP